MHSRIIRYLALAIFAGANVLVVSQIVAQTANTGTASSVAIDIGSGTALCPLKRNNRFERVGRDHHASISHDNGRPDLCR